MTVKYCYKSSIVWHTKIVGVPEWLSGMTRNHVGSARARSNPAAHGFYALSSYFVFYGWLV